MWEAGTGKCSKTDSIQIFFAIVVAEYAKAMGAGDTFPPPTVFRDGTAHWLADGFHRYQAAVTLKVLEVEADVRQAPAETRCCTRLARTLPTAYVGPMRISGGP